jgi:excisionase family DNA binding protein
MTRHHAHPDDDHYLTIDELVDYSHVSRTTLQRLMKADVNPLPHFRIGTRILIRKTDFDAWIQRTGTPRHVAKAQTRAEQLAEAAKKAIGR